MSGRQTADKERTTRRASQERAGRFSSKWITSEPVIRAQSRDAKTISLGLAVLPVACRGEALIRCDASDESAVG